MLVYSIWENMRALQISGEPMEFDSRVPVNAEDWLNVPVIVDATTLPGVAETVVFADQKTISRILNYRPLGGRPVIGLRIKLQQKTPCGISAATKSMPRTTTAARRRTPMPIRIGAAISARFGHRPWRLPGDPPITARQRPGDSTVTARLHLQIRNPITASLAGGIPAFRDGSCPPV
jgi:sulfur-oxidizing protein SoxY